MISYAFQIGTQREISAAEIFVRFQKYNPTLQGGFVIIHADDILPNPQEILDSLGGTIRIIEALPGKRYATWQEALQQLDAKKLLPFLPESDTKMLIGISLFSKKKIPHRTKRFIFSRAIALKRELTQGGKKIRVVNSRDNLEALPSATVYQNTMTTDGIEVCCIEDDEGIFLGRTVAVQNLDAYRERDEKRPFRDPVRGMMPIKLTQILLNLAGLAKHAKILDPFCGLGTTLQEGLRQGFRMYGSDNDQVAITEAERNIDWYRKQYTSPESTPQIRLGDATALPRVWQGESFDGVITEGYLGLPFSHAPNDEEVSRSIKTLEPLITQFLASLKAVLRPQAPVVFALPYYPERGAHGFTLSLDTLTDLGYTFHTQLAALSAAGVLSARQTLLYARPDAHTGREIVLLENKE